MIFDSLRFAVFLGIVFPVTLLLRRRVAARNWWLLLASYFFYGCWDWRFLSLLLVSTLIDYGCARSLDREHRGLPPATPHQRRVLMGVSLFSNLTILGFFKYYNFFIAQAVDLGNFLGLNFSPHLLNVVLPVGISFYTFQTLSYTIDVYRRSARAEESLLDFALYVCFFPQLVAGPIERASRLLPQFKEPQAITRSMLYSGFYLVCWGYIKKVAIADNAGTIVSEAFGVAQPTTGTAFIGGLGFMLQLYCDFSGYTDIARGVARMMGFRLMENFDLPLLALNPRDFWRRWHISLTNWFRDYVYGPMRGRRGERRNAAVVVMATMMLMGLWHGANNTFILFGAFNGVLVIGYTLFVKFVTIPEPKSRPGRILMACACVLLTWTHLMVTATIFRSPSIAEAFNMLGALFSLQSLSIRPLHFYQLLTVVGLYAAVIIYEIFQYVASDHEVLLRAPWYVRVPVYTFGILFFIAFGKFSHDPFIYFQF